MGRNSSSKIRGGKQTNDGGREERERPDQGAADEEQSRIPLPLACMVRMMRQVLSANATISSSAKKLAQDCGAEFVGFISSEAAEWCRQQQRRTLAPDDLVSSLRSLGLERYAEPMAIYLRRYREAARGGAAGASSSRTPVAPALTDDELLEILAQIIDEDGASSPAQAKPPAPHDYDHTGCM